MTHDAIDNWIERAKQAEGDINPANNDIKVIRRGSMQTRGNRIMEIAEYLRPWLTKMYAGVRDENGMLVQPSRIRGIALNAAQEIVYAQSNKIAEA